MSVRKKLRAIMAGKRLVLMPGAYDALSARIMEAEGFEAICAGGYAAIGSMLAQADMGQSNMRDYADHYARICGAVDVPVYVDADTGFGGVNNVRQMVRAFEAAGVAGVFISDQVFPNRCGYLPGKQVIPVEQMLAKIKAALDARRDPDFFIAARTDAAGVDGLNAAIERAQLFMEAGADMAKPMGVDTIEDIKRVMREVGGPHMATLSQAAGLKKRSLEELEAAGVVAATFPSIALFAAANAVRNVLRILKRENSLTADVRSSAAARRLLRAGRAQGDADPRGELRQGGRGADPKARRRIAAHDVQGRDCDCAPRRRGVRRFRRQRGGFLQEQAASPDRRLSGRQRLRSRRAAPGQISAEIYSRPADHHRPEHAAGGERRRRQLSLYASAARRHRARLVLAQHRQRRADRHSPMSRSIRGA